MGHKNISSESLNSKELKTILRQTSEKWFERDLCTRVKKLGGLCIKLSALGFAGIPDRLVLLPGGKVLFVELKSVGKYPEKLQRYWHRKLAALGFIVLVAGSTVKSYIDTLDLIWNLSLEHTNKSE